MIEIKGLKELHDQLQTLPARVEKNVLSGAMNQGINIIRDAAKQTVDSKKIRKAIKSRQVKGKPGSVIRQVYIKDVFYAKFLEFGTASYYTGQGKTVGAPYQIKPTRKKSLKTDDEYFSSALHPGIKPKPFLRPAFDSSSGRAIDAMKSYIKIRLPMEMGVSAKQSITRKMVLEALDDEL